MHDKKKRNPVVVPGPSGAATLASEAAAPTSAPSARATDHAEALPWAPLPEDEPPPPPERVFTSIPILIVTRAGTRFYAADLAQAFAFVAGLGAA